MTYDTEIYVSINGRTILDSHTLRDLENMSLKLKIERRKLKEYIRERRKRVCRKCDEQDEGFCTFCGRLLPEEVLSGN